MQYIPVTPSPHVELNGLVFDNEAVFITLKWNETAESWFMDVVMVDGSQSAYGLRLAPGVNMLYGLNFDKIGGLFVSDTLLTSQEPTYDNLGTQFELWYMTIAELEEYDAVL